MKRNMPLDAARGLAALTMMIFHLAVDLEDFFGYPTGYRYGGWQTLRYFTVILFIGVSGWTIGAGLNKRATRHAFKTLLGALAVSAATYAFLGESYVRFGILHFLSCALFLSPWLRARSDLFLFCLAIFSVAAGRIAAFLSADTALFLPFGVMPRGFVSADYYPLFPWLAVFCAGLLLGRRYSLLGTCRFDNLAAKAAAFLGKRAFFIYLAHQPFFLLCLYVIIG